MNVNQIYFKNSNYKRPSQKSINVKQLWKSPKSIKESYQQNRSLHALDPDSIDQELKNIFSKKHHIPILDKIDEY